MKTFNRLRKDEIGIDKKDPDFEKKQLAETRKKTEDRDSALKKIIKYYQKNDK